jgi:hypothetical protein
VPAEVADARSLLSVSRASLRLQNRLRKSKNSFNVDFFDCGFAQSQFRQRDCFPQSVALFSVGLFVDCGAVDEGVIQPLMTITKFRQSLLGMQPIGLRIIALNVCALSLRPFLPLRPNAFRLRKAPGEVDAVPCAVALDATEAQGLG